MYQQVRPTWAEVDLDRLARNVGSIRKMLPNDCEIFAVVKADGYGHGAAMVAQTALLSGASRLAVSIVDEAWELRRAGIAAPILVLGYTPADQGELAARLGLSLTVYDLENARGLAMAALRSHRTLRLHLKVDTGMGRLGVMPEVAVSVAQQLTALPGCEFEGIYTHLARADDPDPTPTERQLTLFFAVLQQLAEHGIRPPLIHAANSAAALRFPQARLNAIRLGLTMYGLRPHPLFGAHDQVLPAMSLKTTVSHAKWVPAGTALSYGGEYVTERPSYVVTLPVGYGDGYTRLLTGKAEALLRGCRIPIVGAICMDQCMADATEVSGAEIGDEVVLWGAQDAQTITVEQIAEQIGTINYEVICMVSKRVPRIFFRHGQVVDVRTLLGR